MQIPESRRRLEIAGNKLRRARRLYGFLLREEIIRNPNVVAVCAQRALARGLYAQSTGPQTVMFSLVRYSFRFTKPTERYEWHEWLRDNKLQHIWAML